MNPALGVFFHWLGGLASASFYVPYRGVKNWAWETYWLVGGFFSWIIAPWILALTMTHDLLPVLHEAPASSSFLDVHLRSAVGTWRAHFRPDHALSGNVARHGCGARIHGRIRHVDAADFPGSVRIRSPRHAFRSDHSRAASRFAFSASRSRAQREYPKSARCRPSRSARRSRNSI